MKYDSHRCQGRQRHAKRTALIPARIHLIPNGVTRAAVSVVARITILCDEIRNYAMKPRSLVISCTRKIHEVPDRDRRVSAKKLEHDFPAPGANRRSLRSPLKCRHDVRVANVLITTIARAGFP